MDKLTYIFLFLLVSCAKTDPFLAEYNQAAIIENWARCNDAGYMRVHLDHTMDRERMWSMKQDLAKNRCKLYLGEYWVDSL